MWSLHEVMKFKRERSVNMLHLSKLVPTSLLQDGALKLVEVWGTSKQSKARKLMMIKIFGFIVKNMAETPRY